MDEQYAVPPMVDQSLDEGPWAPCPPGQSVVGETQWDHKDPEWSAEKAADKNVPALPVCGPRPDTGVDDSQTGYYRPDDGVPMQIKAIDAREATSWNANTDNKVGGFSNPDEMVSKVLDTAGERPIADLQVIDHGGPGYQEMGDFDQSVSLKDMQDPAKKAQFLATMGRLNGHFSPDGTVEFRGCEAGRGPAGTEYLKENVEAMGVPVSGAHELQYPGLPPTDASLSPYQGAYTTCYPSGQPGVEPSCAVTDPAQQMSYAPGQYVEDPVTQTSHPMEYMAD